MRYYFVSGSFKDKYTNFGTVEGCIKIDEFSTKHIRKHLADIIKKRGVSVDFVTISSIIPITKEEFYEEQKHLNDKL